MQRSFSRMRQCYCNPSKAMQLMKCFIETKVKRLVGFSVAVSPIRSTRRFVWWSSCSRSTRSALYAAAKGLGSTCQQNDHLMDSKLQCPALHHTGHHQSISVIHSASCPLLTDICGAYMMKCC